MVFLRFCSRLEAHEREGRARERELGERRGVAGLGELTLCGSHCLPNECNKPSYLERHGCVSGGLCWKPEQKETYHSKDGREEEKVMC